MTVSYENSKIVFQGIKDAGVKSVSALPETWLGLLLQQAERDADVRLIQVAKEEEAIGVAAGAYFAGERHILLMQNHGFLAAINGIVSLAMLYNIPLCMLIALRLLQQQPEPRLWQRRDGGDARVLDALKDDLGVLVRDGHVQLAIRSLTISSTAAMAVSSSSSRV